ncbi:MAG: winged helix-turn-helix domain-containing protein, partial [Prevotella sp.]|nr:winged helix-turn-helix domain-containing protein [Prevotella sp.]
TTMTANAAAFGANTQARRAAMAHLLFNVFGVIWVMIVFYPFVNMICRIVGYDPSMAGQTEKLPVLLAMFHTCFNVTNTALLLPFIPQIEKACYWLIKPKKTKEKSRLRFIEKGLMVAPEISVLQAQREITRFAERMQRMFGMVRSLLDEKDKKEAENIYERIEKYENIADNMEIEIATYLEEVGKAHLSDNTKAKIRSMMRQIGELESIGDACFSLARILHRKHEGKEDFTADQYEHLHEMLRLANESLAQMIVIVGGRRENQTLDLSEEIEKDINALRDNLRTEHIQAVNAHQYSYMIGTIYVDIINACEKLGDYVMNVVEARLGKATLGYRGLKMNLDKKMVTIDGDEIVLTRTEFNLLHLLLANRGQIFSRQQLMETIWSDVVVSDRTVDVNIARLRKKLGLYAQNIANRQGFGYYFDGE